MANETARRLRKTMTPQEVKLRVHLRSSRTRGYHFRRQSPRSNHIVDFVCLRHRIVVEVDGGQHNERPHQIRDELRDATLNAAGFRVLRFWNNAVDGNLPGVLQAIDRALSETRPHLAACSGHPPPAGEG
jgi:very-short-patch-repair endonuclease